MMQNIHTDFNVSSSYYSISNIKLTSATTSVTSQGRAFLVEECQCPLGYTGSSCEVR